MKELKRGHIYKLDTLDGDVDVRLEFVNRGHGTDSPGTTNQEVLRVLISRLKFLDRELHWPGNEKILYHLRSALLLHEARHFERLVERGELDDLEPEYVTTGRDGHFKILKN